MFHQLLSAVYSMMPWDLEVIIFAKMEELCLSPINLPTHFCFSKILICQLHHIENCTKISLSLIPRSYKKMILYSIQIVKMLVLRAITTTSPFLLWQIIALGYIVQHESYHTTLQNKYILCTEITPDIHSLQSITLLWYILQAKVGNFWSWKVEHFPSFISKSKEHLICQ